MIKREENPWDFWDDTKMGMHVTGVTKERRPSNSRKDFFRNHRSTSMCSILITNVLIPYLVTIILNSVITSLIFPKNKNGYIIYDPFELIFEWRVRVHGVLLFCIRMPSCSSTSYWKTWVFFNELFLYLCQK